MSELVERLRDRANDARPMPKPYNLLLDAAEEIERLRAEIDRFKSERSYIIGVNDGWEEAFERAGAWHDAEAARYVRKSERRKRATHEICAAVMRSLAVSPSTLNPPTTQRPVRREEERE